jgi:glycogen debranching enzyme
MDAKVGDYVVTPRKGMPVEVQALWYNALRIMEGFAVQLQDANAEERFSRMAERAKASFNDLFWNESAGCLFDVVDGEDKDESIRPNQMLAVSLTHPILTGDRALRVIERVERDLLTPVGLRSLARNQRAYRPRYGGDSWTRDTGYHQGTVWSWLLGPFITGYLKVKNYSDPAKEKARQWLRTFEGHLLDAGVGQVSEIFDADSPHQPRGCIAQAWSVGEILRATVEDVLQIRPKFEFQNACILASASVRADQVAHRLEEFTQPRE